MKKKKTILQKQMEKIRSTLSKENPLYLNKTQENFNQVLKNLKKSPKITPHYLKT